MFIVTVSQKLKDTKLCKNLFFFQKKSYVIFAVLSIDFEINFFSIKCNSFTSSKSKNQDRFLDLQIENI